MRTTIEFRGKRIDNGEWVHGYVYRQCDKTGQEHTFITTIYGDKFEVSRVTIGQFTDCVDRNGDFIFEGDILHYEGQRPDNRGKHYYRAVVYHKGAFRFRLEDGSPGAYLGENSWNWDIVGNIHDDDVAQFQR